MTPKGTRGNWEDFLWVPPPSAVLLLVAWESYTTPNRTAPQTLDELWAFALPWTWLVFTRGNGCFLCRNKTSQRDKIIIGSLCHYLQVKLTVSHARKKVYCGTKWFIRHLWLTPGELWRHDPRRNLRNVDEKSQSWLKWADVMSLWQVICPLRWGGHEIPRRSDWSLNITVDIMSQNITVDRYLECVKMN